MANLELFKVMNERMVKAERADHRRQTRQSFPTFHIKNGTQAEQWFVSQCVDKAWDGNRFAVDALDPDEQDRLLSILNR